MRLAWALALLLLAAPAAAFEVRCPNGVRWIGSDPGACPCCEVCPDGSWHIEGEDECIVYADMRPVALDSRTSTLPPEKRPSSFPPRYSEESDEPEEDGLMSLLLALPILLASLAVYFLPFANAKSRKHHNADAILLLNLFLGWTGLGWVVALVWSATAVEPQK